MNEASEDKQDQNKDYFAGMSEQDIADYREAEARILQEEIEQHHKDTIVIRETKKLFPKHIFKQIAVLIHESEKAFNFRIVENPTGQKQMEGKLETWVDQYTEFEDCYSGHFYVKLPNGKFLAWDYNC